MISEGSYDLRLEYDAEHSALPSQNKLHFEIYYNTKELLMLICNNISEYYYFYNIFN